MIEKMFENPAQFSLHIEELASTKNLSYMEALMYFCEYESDAEYEDIAEMISAPLKEKIYMEATKNYSMPKRTSAPLDE